MTAPIAETTSFAALGISPELCAALESEGFASAFPIQSITIPDVLAGRDVCGKAKTGQGKTLAFGTPMLDRIHPAAPGRPRAIILVPTRELCQQVTDVLGPLAAALDRRVAAVYGGAPMDKQVQALRDGCEVVIATPGRLIAHLQDGTVHLDDVDFVVLDEADRMADMGFLPQVEWILRHLPGGGRMHTEHPKPQTLLFSATLDGQIGHVAKRYLDEPVYHEVVSEDPTVEQMAHLFLQVHPMDKHRVIARLASKMQKCLVFVNTKRGADRLVDKLRADGVKAVAIHGDRSQKDRERALRGFAEGQTALLVATDVAARGLDIEGVDMVIQAELPEDHKTYLHRAGRTARAGATGIAVLLLEWNQQMHVKVLQRRLKMSEPVVEVFSTDPLIDELIDELAGAESHESPSEGTEAFTA